MNLPRSMSKSEILCPDLNIVVLKDDEKNKTEPTAGRFEVYTRPPQRIKVAALGGFEHNEIKASLRAARCTHGDSMEKT